MTRIIIPRGSCCSAKVVSSSDFELYFCPILPTYAECGWCVTDPCMGLAACVAAGKARFLGLHLENSATCQVTGLTMCAINHIYATVTRDAMCKVSSWAFTTNTTGCVPTLSFKIGTATTNCAQVTAVTTCIIPRTIRVGAVPTNAQIGCYSTCICDYTTPTAAVGTTEGCVPCTPLLCETFCCDNWTDNPVCCSRVAVNTCTNVLDFDLPISTAVNQNSSLALQACPLSCTRWLMRFKLNMSCVNDNNDGTGQRIFIGIADTAGLVNANQDSIWFGIITNSAGEFYYTSTTNGAQPFNSARTNFSCLTPATCDQIFVEISRTSTTNANFRIYSCACFCMLTEEMCQTVNAATIGLRFVKVLADAGDATPCGRLTGTVDCLQIWDNISSTRACQAIDGCTNTFWQSDSETNPAIYVDMMCAVDATGIAIHPNSNTTITVAKIRASTDATFTDSENVRTIQWSDLTNCMYNFINFNRLPEDRRFIQIIGDDAGAAILSINEIEINCATNIDRIHGHLEICPNDKDLTLEGF